MFHKKRWKRQSYFFTANRGIFSSVIDVSKISYKLDMPYNENNTDDQYLFTRSGFPPPTDSALRRDEWENWEELGKSNSVINKKTVRGWGHNLFFIGTYSKK